MTLSELLNTLQTQPESVQFDDVINTINNEYTYTPSKFTNGLGDDIVTNESKTNEGSCKILAFATLNELSTEQTLSCFGKYYREDVLQHPDGTDHANIRVLMKYALDDVFFYDTVLVKKSAG